jgi:predicted ATPase
MRRGFTLLQGQNSVLFDGIMNATFAIAEAQAGDHAAALARIDQAIATSERTGQRWFDAELYRIRGEILFMRDAAKSALAEESFLTAIAIAQRQKARSFELRAALSLAKLYRAGERYAAAVAVLGPALEKIAWTPEFPELEEARTLLTISEVSSANRVVLA